MREAREPGGPSLVSAAAGAASTEPGRLVVCALLARAARPRVRDAGRRPDRDAGVCGEALPVSSGARGAVGPVRLLDRAAGGGLAPVMAWGPVPRLRRAGQVRSFAPQERSAMAGRSAGGRRGCA